MTDPADRDFSRRLLEIYTGSVLTDMIEIGHRTGLFESAAGGPATSDALARRAGLQERYVREWLGAMTTAGIMRHDAPSGTYTLPEAHAALLTGDGAGNVAPQSRLLNSLGLHVPRLIEVFREGGGIPYEAYRPEFTDALDAASRGIYDAKLIETYFGGVPGLLERMRAGGLRVLDVGCGSGHIVNLLAGAFPGCSFVGFDIAEDAIARARAEAEQTGLRNVRFEIADAEQFTDDAGFDVILAIDAIHDQRGPALVLRRIREALAPGGIYLMAEFKFSSRVEHNVGNPFAPLYYGISVLHCVPVSLAAGGPGLGTVWGDESIREMLAAAGFGAVERFDAPRPQNCIYACRRADA